MSICVAGHLCRRVLDVASFGSPASVFVFALGEGRSLFYRRGDGVSTWTSDWISLGGPFASPPATIVWRNSTTAMLNVFVVTVLTQNLIWRHYYDGNFVEFWEDLGVSGIRSPVSLCSHGSQLSAWVINGPDDSLAIHHKYWKPGYPLWADDFQQRYREIKPASAVGVV